MNERLRNLYDEKGRVWARMEELIAADQTTEARAEYDRMEADLTRIQADIDRETRHENRAAANARTQIESPTAAAAGDASRATEADAEVNERAYAGAFESWIRRGMNGLSAEHRAILEERGANLPDEVRAMSALDGAGGGFTIPPAFRDRITVAMEHVGNLASHMEQLNTSTGQPLPWPTVDDTANEGVIVGENQSHEGATDLSFGERTIGSFTISSRVIVIPMQLTRDSGTDIEGFVARRLGERLGRTRNRHATLGTGANQPQGAVNFAIGKTGANGQTTSIIWEDLVDLIHSVNRAYRGDRARFELNDLSVATIRKLKGSDGHPIWRPGLVDGEPDRILNYPYGVNDHVPVMAASAKSVAFGDFTAGMVWRNVGGMQMLRLTERYAEKLQVGLLAFASWDCGIQDAAAVRWYSNSAI